MLAHRAFKSSAAATLRVAACAFVLGATLLGCATQKEYTPAEYRDAARNYKGIFSALVSVETIDTPRPYAQLTDTLRKKSKECLDVLVESSGMVKQGFMWVRETSRVQYTPIFTAGKTKTELTVQGQASSQKFGNPVYAVDLEPAGRNSTRITYYRAKIGISNTVHTAVEGWVKGEAMGCPSWND